MPELLLVVASNRRQVRDAQRVRWRVYGEEEGLLSAARAQGGSEIDARDDSEHTTHLLVYVDREPVGTVRLLRAAPGAGDELPGLDLARKFELTGFTRPGLVVAEVTRFCVLARYRCTRVCAALFDGLLSESLRHGVTHWIAGANTQTDNAEDAWLMYRAIQARGLESSGFCARARDAAGSGSGQRRAYTSDERARALRADLASLRLPKPLSLFSARMGARYMGPPAYDAFFGVFAMPLVSELRPLAEARRRRQVAPHAR
jgi:hypothetical protein